MFVTQGGCELNSIVFCALSANMGIFHAVPIPAAVKGGVSNSLCEEAREGYARALAALVGCSDPNALLLRSHIASNAVDVAWAQLGQDSVVYVDASLAFPALFMCVHVFVNVCVRGCHAARRAFAMVRLTRCLVSDLPALRVN